MADDAPTETTASARGTSPASEVDSPEDLQVAKGDDAEGAVGSEAAPREVEGQGRR